MSIACGTHCQELVRLAWSSPRAGTATQHCSSVSWLADTRAGCVSCRSGSDSNSDAAVYYVPANKTYDANQTYYTKKSYWPSASDSDEDVTTQSIRIMVRCYTHLHTLLTFTQFCRADRAVYVG